MKKIVRILMNRDGLTEQEAEKEVAFTKELIHEALSSGADDEVEDIMYGYLGLEMDYIFDLI